MRREILIVERVLKAHEEWAIQTRRLLAEKDTYCLNLIGAPGAGKTSLLEETLRRWPGGHRPAVLEGDVATALDAERIAAVGGEVIQINTAGGCHIDAHLVYQAMRQLDLAQSRLVFIENVGNLVCPAGFDIGEHAKVAVSSVPEGADKPEKYPRLFQEAEIVVLNKIDLIPYTNFSLEHYRASLAKVRPQVRLFPLSCTTGEGLEDWLEWLRNRKD